MQAPDSGHAPHRAPVLGADAMVSSSHPQVSCVGLKSLAAGGNAVDAAIAMAAMSWLVLPGQCGIGGDLFAVVREPTGRVWTVGGSGFGPDGGDPDFYRSHGLRSLPLEGPLAVAVPGTPAAVATLHAQGATRSLAELWAPSIIAAERGVPCTAKTRADILEHLAALRRDDGAARVLAPGGQVPPVGQLVVHHELAATMRALAADPTSFYSGELAERAVAALRAGGAPFSGDEWEAGREVGVEPAITHAYGAHVPRSTRAVSRARAVGRRWPRRAGAPRRA